MPRQLLGTAIVANTVSTTQLTTAVVNQLNSGGGPRVSSLVYPDNDTAANTAGGQTIYVVGSGFAANAAVYVNGNAVPSISFISSSNLQITTPALSSATYPLYVINPENGATAIHIPGLIVSGEPSWVTAAGSLNAAQDELSAWSYSLSATGDTPITYALAAGSSLPTGVSLAANGVISGTISSPTGNTTTYTFSVVASDAQNQDSTRQFTVTTATGEGALFANNVLLIHADGTNNGNNHAFLDSSNNNFTITRNGNATQGSFSPFSQTGWSNLFDGVDDNLSVSAGSGSWADFGSGEFTIEAWIFPRTVSTLQGICGTHTGGTNTWQFRLNNATLEIFGGASGGTAYAGGSVAANTWTHVAACRSGTNVYVFVNGILTTRSVGSSDTFPAGTNVTIGNLYSSPSAYWFNGYISNLRILKGTALYTSSFTPSTSALTAISNTSLLTCQSNRFIDNSTNAFTVTGNGDVSVQPLSPFAPTAAYSTANVGGSGYFDGTGDYLTVPDNNAWDFGTGDFTIECWLYPTTSGTQRVICSAFSNGGNDGWSFEFTSGNLLTFYAEAAFRVTSTGTVLANTWTHVAVSRSGTSLKLFINGVTDGSVTDSTNISGQTDPLGIAATPSGSVRFTGYQSNLRIIKGTALYTTNFTPPTSPLTNIANTQLLLNFTNAQIFDQTAKNVLECIGDAKVSTAQYKYGTGSIVFDGTGDAIRARQTNPLLKMGSANFTIEAWVYFNAVSSRAGVFHAGWGAGTYATDGGFTLDIGTSSGQLSLAVGTVNSGAYWFTTSASPAFSTGQWYHIALVRNGVAVTIYRDGTSIGTNNLSTASTLMANMGIFSIGCYDDNTFGFNGYIDDLRITRGYARYTSNFTPPASALKDK